MTADSGLTGPRGDVDKTSHFDADAATAAQEQPTLMVGNYLYRGRLLSIEEWLPWWEKSLALQRDRDRLSRVDPMGNFRKLNAFYRDYLRVLFPRSRFRWWAPDPVKHLMDRPFSVVEEAVIRFFYLQARATFGEDAIQEVTATRLAPPGTPLQPATPSEPREV